MLGQSTRDRIIDCSLDLFSVKGYQGVSMRDIATEVGIKAASIYKHFSNKEAIYSAIVELFQEKTAEIFQTPTENEQQYMSITPEAMCEMVKQTFSVYVQEPFLSKCRKLFLISGFERKEIGRLYVGSFIQEPIGYNTRIFQMRLAQKENKGKQWDAESMAYQFYAPVLSMMQEYDYGVITLEDALEKVERSIKQFTEVYKL
nr:TetR/AcrR family transcriptional regulator [Eubacterium sp.]